MNISGFFRFVNRTDHIEVVFKGTYSENVRQPSMFAFQSFIPCSILHPVHYLRCVELLIYCGFHTDQNKTEFQEKKIVLFFPSSSLFFFFFFFFFFYFYIYMFLFIYCCCGLTSTETIYDLSGAGKRGIGYL